MTHAMDPHRCALRMIAHTLAMAATLTAPAALQALLLMRPDAFAPDQAAAAMSGVLAATLVAFPAVLRRLLAGMTASPAGLPGLGRTGAR